MTIDALDSQSTQQNIADLQTSASSAAASASASTKDSYEVSIDGLDLILNKDYSFVFRYLLQNADPEDKTQNFGPYSPRVYIPASQVYAALPDNRTTPTNVSFIAGFNSYQVKWDKPTFNGYVDTIVWESPTNIFNSSSTVVYIGNSNQINILTSNTDSRYVKIIHRDKILHADVDPSKDSKFVIIGPITPKDPVVVDTTGPSNVSGVSTSGGIDSTGYLGFNGYANVSWSAVTDGDIRGYRIRFKPTTSSVYSYADSPGTATSYKLTGLAVGVTYNIEVATYDQYNNTSTSYVAGTNISIPGTPTMTGYISAGAFKFGDGVVTGKRGLYFNDNNYWYIDSSSTAALHIGGSTTNYLSWDGSELHINGNLGVDGSTKIGGNIQLTTSGASIYNGTINTNGNLTGNGFALNSTGLKVANGLNSVTLDASTGTITANAGSIGGWTLSSTTISRNNISLDSAGQIRAGSSAAASVYIDGTNNNQIGTTGVYYKMWAGNNNPSLASFSVDSNGVLRATNAIISGSISVGSTLSDGTSFSDIKTGAATGATALQPNGTLTGNVSGTVGGVAVATVTAGATKGNSAVQPGNGISVDSTTKIINAIQASSGMKISSGGSRPVYMDNTGLYMTNAATGLYSIFLDASTGDAVFRGTVYASSGEFSGSVKVINGTKSVNISSTNATIDIADTSGGFLGGGGLTITSGNNYLSLGSGAILFNGTAGLFTNAALGGYGTNDVILTAPNNADLYLGANSQSGWIRTNRPINASSWSISAGDSSGTATNTADNAMINNNGYVLARRYQGIPAYFGRYGSSGTVEAVRFNYSTSFATMSDAGGINISTGTPSFRAPSDYRLKEDILDYTEGLDKINLARVRSFVMKSDPEKNVHIGFIAHEFAEAFPDFVQGTKDAIDADGNPEYQSIMTTNLIPHIVSAVQSLSKEINILKQKLDAIGA